MKMALAEGGDKDDPMIGALKILEEVEGVFNRRLEMLKAAHRLLWAASYVHGVS